MSRAQSDPQKWVVADEEEVIQACEEEMLGAYKEALKKHKGSEAEILEDSVLAERKILDTQKSTKAALKLLDTYNDMVLQAELLKIAIESV